MTGKAEEKRGRGSGIVGCVWVFFTRFWLLWASLLRMFERMNDGRVGCLLWDAHGVEKSGEEGKEGHAGRTCTYACVGQSGPMNE